MSLVTGAIFYLADPLPNSILSAYPLYFFLAKVLMIIMLLAHGTFYGSRSFQLVFISIGVLILGALFKILHIVGADMMLSLGAFMIPIVYLIYFVRKESRRVIDYFKLMTVAFTFIPMPFLFLHVVEKDVADYYSIAGDILILIVFLHFVATGIRSKTLLKN